ncbi:MAG: ribosomal RNA small subunit methyltransferase A [Deltaproteobacteria bacterium]|nr:MAG: ribosomal RNA small subunit methyltransferase A [Deltaproteobacteria bacterium]
MHGQRSDDRCRRLPTPRARSSWARPRCQGPPAARSGARVVRSGGRRRPRWGQNFLVDQSVAGAIVDWAAVDGRDVIEIGPGRGALTELLAERAGRLVLVEIDPQLCEALTERFRDERRVKVVCGDAREIDLCALVEPRAVVVANLPYESGTAIVMRLLEHYRLFSHLVVMLQREVCERMAAPPGSPARSALSVHVELVADVELGRRVPPGCFRPAPKVESRIAKIRLLERPRAPIGRREVFDEVVRQAFSGRRKMVRNTLGRYLAARCGVEQAAALLESAGIDPRQRPATIPLRGFAALSRALSRLEDAGA